MDANPCRDVVLYMPVWRADWVDEVPPLISEEDYLAQMIMKQEHVGFDEPIVWTPAPFTATSAVAIEHHMWMNWYIPNEARGPPPPTLAKGERHLNLDYDYLPLALLSAPILGIDYDFYCPRRCLCDCHKKIKAKL
ncbi:hypothetical protein B0H11DRAFT_2254125 [Mycena galericulata]|nr:hypothetical protein B0H11DRAFT_2254125 [Mycena galericulata]